MPKLPNLLFLPFERLVKYLKLGSSFPYPVLGSSLLDKHLLLFSSHQDIFTIVYIIGIRFMPTKIDNEVENLYL